MKKALPWAVILIAAAVWLYFSWPALHSLHLRWIKFDEAYAVGYPIVLMGFFWLFDRRHAIFHGAAAPAFSALPLLMLVLLMSTAGSLTYLQLLPQLAVPLLFWLLLASLLGWRAAMAAVAPCAILYLAIPWMDISDPLRRMTVWFCQHLLDLLNVPAMIDGFDITLTSGVIHVAGSCSGFNLLLSALFTGLMYGEIARQPAGRRILLVALAAVIGIIDNWIRVLALVLIAHYSNMTSELVYHHGNFGWWIFAASLLPYFFLASRIEAPIAAPAAQESKPFFSPAFALPQMAAAALVAIVLMLGSLTLLDHLRNRSGFAVNGFELPSGATAIQPIWLPHYQSPDVSQAFWMPGEMSAYEALALTYVQQRADKKLIYYANYIAEEDQLRGTGRVDIEPGFAVNTAVVKGREWRVTWWFWWVDGATAVSPLKTKLLQLKATLTGDPSAALLLISKTCEAEVCAEEAANPSAEARHLLQMLRRLKPQSSPAR